ncbi:MAG: glycosyltransferase [Gammaproteobacteria bacterium]|jgi:glycosyltransferase involved in cell wall biosynthesis|nr:glycosyltransferase [Gammaproteobacteria bacterium]
MTPRILSIVIPVRNQPGTLAKLLEALDKLVMPEGWQIEIICVDNASTDSTPAVIERHGARYLREERLGPSHARNRGAAAAAGELLWFIDADALPAADDFLLQLVSAVAELGDFGGIGGPIVLPAEQRRNPIAFADHMACWSAWHPRRPTAESDFQPTSLVVRRSVFEAVGGYDTGLRVLEDWDLQHRLIRSRRIAEGPEAPLRPIWFLQNLPVAHYARSSILRSLRHSWYWGLPSRVGWLQRDGIDVRPLERPVLRWLAWPRLLWQRVQHPLRTGWRTSRVSAVLSAPFLVLTLAAWTTAVIVGRGQPEDDRFAPV